MRLSRYDDVAPSKDQRSAFSCGEPSLDRWLTTQARQSMRSRDAVTYLLLDEESEVSRIAGYFCLSAGEVRREDAPSGVARRAPEAIPVVRMGRFAIDEAYQGKGWGAEMLREALLSAVSGGRLIGARALLVDAVSEQAIHFYKRFGFIESPIRREQLFYALRVVELSAGLFAPR
ncbi:MAG: GNAT family N-acetyltransferase [Acidobacteria bacterium]|nr:MAG: GNAT family N-acetyltransferase [Acidobacteriota bacterium]